MATTVHRCCETLRSAARTARRQRLHALGRSYDRARHLPAALPEFTDRPGHPLARLSNEAASALQRGDSRFTRRIGRALARRLGGLLRRRARRDVESRIDLLRAALAGEWRLYRQQRAPLRRREAA